MFDVESMPMTCYLIMSEINGYKNVANNYIYSTRYDAEADMAQLQKKYDNKTFYILTMGLLD